MTTADCALAAPAVSAPPAPSPLELILSDPARLEVPYGHVILKEIHRGTKPGLFIHIQDAHANPGAQLNLAEALRDMMTRYGISLVLVEGGSQDVNLDKVRAAAPPEVWSKVARRFLGEGKLAGEEYLNLTSEIPMRTIGIERQELYDEALSTYAELASARKSSLTALYGVRTALGRIKNRIYPRELVAYEDGKAKDSQKFRSGYAELVRLAREAGVSFDPYPGIRGLEKILALEASVDFDAANAERAKLMDELALRKKDGFWKSFTEARAAVQANEISQYAFWRALAAAARDAGIGTAPYPALERYGAYLEAFQALDFAALIAELDLLENDLYAKKLASDDAKKIRAVDRFTSLLYDATSIRLSSADSGVLKANQPDFGTDSFISFVNRMLLDLGYDEDLVAEEPEIDRSKPLFERFYRLVDERDETFIANSVAAMEAAKTNAAFLITGGYHTEHLGRLLAQEGYSYVVLAPIVTEATDLENYEKILLGSLRPRESRAASDGMLRPARIVETALAPGSRLAELIGAAKAFDRNLNLDAKTILNVNSGSRAPRTTKELVEWFLPGRAELHAVDWGAEEPHEPDFARALPAALRNTLASVKAFSFSKWGQARLYEIDVAARSGGETSLPPYRELRSWLIAANPLEISRSPELGQKADIVTINAPAGNVPHYLDEAQNLLAPGGAVFLRLHAHNLRFGRAWLENHAAKYGWQVEEMTAPPDYPSSRDVQPFYEPLFVLTRVAGARVTAAGILKGMMNVHLDAGKRLEAVRRLRRDRIRYGITKAQALSALLAALRDDRARVSVEAAKALAELNINPRRTLRALAAELEDPRISVRRAAEAAYAQISAERIRSARPVIFAIVGPPGVGKTTMVRLIMQNHPGLFVKIPVTTTRTRRPDETETEFVKFVSPDKYREELAAGAIYFSKTVMGHERGYHREDLLAALDSGKTWLLEHWDAVELMREFFPDARVHKIFVSPSDPKIWKVKGSKEKAYRMLTTRLKRRQPDITDEELRLRTRGHAHRWQPYLDGANLVLINDAKADIQDVFSDLESYIQEQIARPGGARAAGARRYPELVREPGIQLMGRLVGQVRRLKSVLLSDPAGKYHSRPQENLPFHIESISADIAQAETGLGGQDAASLRQLEEKQKLLGLALKAKKNMDRAFEVVDEIFPRRSRVVRNGIAFVGVFTETRYLIPYFTSPKYSWGMLRNSRGRPIAFVSVPALAALESRPGPDGRETSPDMIQAALALVYAHRWYRLYAWAKARGMDEGQVNRIMTRFERSWETRVMKPRTTAGFVFRHATRAFVDKALILWFRARLTLDYNRAWLRGFLIDFRLRAHVFRKTGILTLTPDNREITENIEMRNEQISPLLKRLVFLMRRAMAFGDYPMALQIVRGSHRFLFHLGVADTGMSPMQSYIDYLKLLVRLNRYEEFIDALEGLKGGALVLHRGHQLNIRPQEKSIFLLLAHGGNLEGWIRGTITDQMEAMANDKNRATVGLVRRDALRLLSEITAEFSAPPPAPAPGGARLPAYHRVEISVEGADQKSVENSVLVVDGHRYQVRDLAANSLRDPLSAYLAGIFAFGMGSTRMGQDTNRLEVTYGADDIKIRLTILNQGALRQVENGIIRYSDGEIRGLPKNENHHRLMLRTFAYLPAVLNESTRQEALAAYGPLFISAPITHLKPQEIALFKGWRSGARSAGISLANRLFLAVGKLQRRAANPERDWSSREILLRRSERLLSSYSARSVAVHREIYGLREVIAEARSSNFDAAASEMIEAARRQAGRDDLDAALENVKNAVRLWEMAYQLYHRDSIERAIEEADDFESELRSDILLKNSGARAHWEVVPGVTPRATENFIEQDGYYYVSFGIVQNAELLGYGIPQDAIDQGRVIKVPLDKDAATNQLRFSHGFEGSYTAMTLKLLHQALQLPADGGFVVYDLGAGVGPIAQFAAKNEKVKKVIAVEREKRQTDMMIRSLMANNISSDRVQVFSRGIDVILDNLILQPDTFLAPESARKVFVVNLDHNQAVHVLNRIADIMSKTGVPEKHRPILISAGSGFDNKHIQEDLGVYGDDAASAISGLIDGMKGQFERAVDRVGANLGLEGRVVQYPEGWGISFIASEESGPKGTRAAVTKAPGVKLLPGGLALPRALTDLAAVPEPELREIAISIVTRRAESGSRFPVGLADRSRFMYAEARPSNSVRFDGGPGTGNRIVAVSEADIFSSRREEMVSSQDKAASIPVPAEKVFDAKREMESLRSLWIQGPQTLLRDNDLWVVLRFQADLFSLKEDAADEALIRHLGFLNAIRERWRQAGVQASIQLDISPDLRRRARTSPALRELIRAFDAERGEVRAREAEAKIVHVRTLENLSALDSAGYDKAFGGQIVLGTPSLASYDRSAMPYMDLAQLSTDLVQSARQAAQENRLRKMSFLRRFERASPDEVVLLLTGKASFDMIKKSPLVWPRKVDLERLLSFFATAIRELQFSK